MAMNKTEYGTFGPTLITNILVRLLYECKNIYFLEKKITLNGKKGILKLERERRLNLYTVYVLLAVQLLVVSC